MEKTTLQYVRRLEQALSRLTAGPRVFTQRDWHLATRWCESGIPVGLVLEVLNEAGCGVASLSKISKKVESSWEAVRKGRRDTSAPNSEKSGTVTWEQGLENALERSAEIEEVRALILDLLEEGRSGASSSQLEAILAERLPGAVPAEDLEASRLDAENSLAAQRNRMPPDMFRKTVKTGVLARLRKKYRISRIRK